MPDVLDDKLQTSQSFGNLVLSSYFTLLMDFLKSAVASAISKGPPFPYNFGDRVDVDTSVWNLFNGTKRVGQGPRKHRVLC
jgi:hypothetical protein